MGNNPCSLGLPPTDDMMNEFVSLARKNDIDGLASMLSENSTLVNHYAKRTIKVNRKSEDKSATTMISEEREELMTALMAATIKGHVRVIEYLLNHGADPNLANHDGATALMKACKDGNCEIVNLLISGGAELDKQTILEKDFALAIACENDKWECVKLLIDHGADWEQRDKDGKTALIRAAEKSNISAIEALFRCAPGLRVNAKDSTDATALIYAVRANCVDTTQQLLLKHGADPNKQDFIGESALIVASKLNNLKIAKMLLDKGADPNLTYLNNFTALRVAETEEMVELLTKAGAKK